MDVKDIEDRRQERQFDRQRMEDEIRYAISMKTLADIGDNEARSELRRSMLAISSIASSLMDEKTRR